ncbi:MAG: AtpZ/AtpI family protein [Candidatus Kapaibacteriota bacterium]
MDINNMSSIKSNKSNNKVNKKEPLEDKQSEQNESNASRLAINLGIELITPIILGALVGNWLDNKNSTTPKWTVILLFVGIVVGIYNFYKIIKQLNKLNK